ncbi:sodium- and chloride-dependent glycine transporter 2-like, partial [Ylistrum balloti]|uniref:sodium- and chloride-dependent glycine transporter 2-like n=1 Tax=Ylistrum balloti TaxID=509963 RepID=UPI002905F6DF
MNAFARNPCGVPVRSDINICKRRLNTCVKEITADLIGFIMEEETAFDEDHNTEESIGKRNQGTWDNRVEYILSLSGYTTGSSDFWRFPYLIWRYGGGTFILAYIFSAAVVAVPVYYLEVTVAQFSGRGMFDVWEISPIMKGLGIGMFIINFEYLIIAPTFRLWIMQYIGYSFMSPLPWKRCDNPWNTPACVDLYITLPANSTKNISQGEISAHNVSSAITAPPGASRRGVFPTQDTTSLNSVYDLGTFRWDLCLCLLVFTTLCAASVIKDVKSIGK